MEEPAGGPINIISINNNIVGLYHKIMVHMEAGIYMVAIIPCHMGME